MRPVRDTAVTARGRGLNRGSLGKEDVDCDVHETIQEASVPVSPENNPMVYIGGQDRKVSEDYGTRRCAVRGAVLSQQHVT